MADVGSDSRIPATGARENRVIKERRMIVVQPEDVDQVLDMYISQGRLEKDPYWCRVWPSAIGLCEEVFDHTELVKGRGVCDLGAGLGLAGLAAAFAGAKRVVLLDQEPLALLCALLSFHVNFPAVSTNLSSLLKLHFPQTDTRSLEFMSSASHGCALQVHGELFDWTEENPVSEFDIVLACDLLYEKSAASHLAKLAPTMLRMESLGSKFLLADPVERTPKHREAFLELVQSSSHQLQVRERYRKKTLMDEKSYDLEFILLEH